MRISIKCYMCDRVLPHSVNPEDHTFSVTFGSLSATSGFAQTAETFLLCAKCFDKVKASVTNPVVAVPKAKVEPEPEKVQKTEAARHAAMKKPSIPKPHIPTEEELRKKYPPGFFETHKEEILSRLGLTDTTSETIKADPEVLKEAANATKEKLEKVSDAIDKAEDDIRSMRVDGKTFKNRDFKSPPSDSTFKAGVLGMCRTADYIRSHKMSDLDYLEQAMKVSDAINKAADDDLLRCKVNENGCWVEIVKRKDIPGVSVTPKEPELKKLNMLTAKAIKLTGKQCSMSGTRLWNLRYCQESSGMSIAEFAEFYNVSESKVRNLLIDVCASKSGRKYDKSLQPYSPKGESLRLFKDIAKDFDCKVEDLCKVYKREFSETLEFKPAL